MKKIYSLFMALSIVLSVFAQPTNPVGRRLDLSNTINPTKVTKVEKVTKQAPQAAERQAIAKKVQNAPKANLNGVRESKALNVLNVEKQKLSNTAKKVAAKKTDDVTTPDTIVVSADIWQYKYYAETYDWYMVIANEANDKIIYLDYFSDDFAGTFTEADLDLYYSYILAVDEEGYANYIDIVEANIVVTDDENGKSADVTILASDGNVYVTYAYEAPLPEPVGEKTLDYTTAELVDLTASSGLWQFWAEENGWYTSIVMAAAQVEGEYARVDMADPYYNYLAYFTETDTTIIDMLDINATVTKEGKTYTLVADVLGSDAILYHITMSYTRPDPTDTVNIVATDLYIDEFEFWGMVFVTADASNDEYSVFLTANDYLTAGQYGSSDWKLGSCEITDKVNQTTTTLFEADLTVAGEGAARTIVGSVLGADNVLYNLDLSYEVPEVADTVVVVFETPGVAEWYDADSDYFMYNENDEYFVYLDMITEKDNFVGEFTAEDFLLNYTAMGEIVDGDSTLILAADAKAVVTAVGENLVHIDAELTGKNGTLYLVSTDMQLPGKGLKYDTEEGEVNRTYAADEITITTDYVAQYGELYVELMAGDNSDYTQLLFYVEEEAEGTVIPVGTYTIDDSADYGTVSASTGYNSNYGPIPSFYSTLLTKEDGLYYGSFFFLVSGTVTVEEVNGALKITVDGLNSYDLPVHIVYEAASQAPVKPEPTYTENKLNPYAFGLESVLAEDALVVTYRLNNSNATSVNVLVYNGEEVVATVPGTTTIGVNTVEVATAELPAGVELTWAVEVNGTSVEAPTLEEKIYSFYHPSGVDIDNNPENATFGMLLVNEGMQSVASKTEGYVSAGFGAGIFAFTPSFDLIPNGELPGYKGGVEFTTTRADGTGTAYAPRRIRISEDGRIFVTSLNTDGNYLWEVNAENLDEWTPVFRGELNDQKELIDAEGNFVAAPNNGLDVKGAGENLQLAMYSVNLSGITAAAMGGFRLSEYNLGTATEWATAPSKALVEGKYAINYTGTQVEYDNEGGFWIASYRGSATDANPGLVHINAEGVEDAKLIWNNVRQAGIRFNNDFTKLVVAGNNGAAKKATIYAVSKDENGAPVLTEETVVDMAVVGNNLNDFAWDYAGNLYSCGNSSEKLAAWAMPYAGQVVTPAAAKYAFELESLEVMELTMTNLSVDNYGSATGLWASDMDNGIEVMLFLDAEGNLMEESSIMVGWMDYPVTGTVEVSYSEELATDVYYAELYTTVGETNYKLLITMYNVPVEPTVLVVENATIDDQTETSGFMYMNGEAEIDGVVYPVSAEVPGFDATVAEAVYDYVSVTVGGWGDEDPWLGFVQGSATVTVVDNVVTLTGVMSSWDGLVLDITISGIIEGGEPVEPVEMVGVVKRVLYNGYDVVVLTHEEDGTAHIYNIVEGDVLEVSQEGVIAVDAENAGDLLAISDIALTEDGKLVAVNSMVCQSAEDYVDAGYKRGETRFYIWNDLAGDPAVWFKSNMYGNWFRSKEGYSMALKGDSQNAQIMVTSIHATKYWSRFSVYSVIDGVYNEPADAATGNEHYTWCEGPATGDLDENVTGVKYELNASPLATANWIVDGELVDPIEFVQPEAIKDVIATWTPVNEDLGKKYNGASYITVNGTVYMVAPFATPAGDLVAVEILDITNGLDAAQYVDMLYLDEAVAATAAATAVTVVENTLVISLVADATLYSFELPLGNDGDDWQLYEDAITNLVIDYDNMLLIGGPSEAFQVEVVLGLGDYDRNTDNFALLPESSISVYGSEATFVEGYASVDGIAQTALAVVRCMWNGMALEFHLTMSAAALEATVVVVENAAIEIEKYLLWGDMYDYALKMTGNWINEEDGLTYPVLVEVPVYYPEATEPYDMYSTVTVGGMGDDDPWLGFGEGYLTITEVDNVITATGVVENPMAGVAIDITISGTKVGTSVENATVTVKAVKSIKNGQLIIEKNGVQYNAQGAKL